MLTLTQSNEYKRAKTLNNFLSQNNTVFSVYPPFAQEYKLFNNNINLLDGFIPNKDVVRTGITKDKAAMKLQVANDLLPVCTATRAYAIKQGNETLAADMHFSETTLMRMKDADVLAFAQRIQTIITPLLTDPDFAAYGITSANLDTAVADATDFNSSIGQASITGADSTVANKNINDTIKLIRANIVQFGLLINYFRVSDPDFFAGYHINSAVDNAGVRHSGIEGIVTAAADGQPVAGALVSFAEMNKSAVTDSLGHYSIMRIKQGIHSVEISAAGFATQTLSHHIIRAQVDEVNVVLDALAPLHNN